MDSQPGVPCWVDTWQDDGDAAASFYTALFGWEAARGEYSMFRLRGRDVAGFGGAGRSARAAWTTYVQVDDADAAARRGDRCRRRARDREPFDSLDGGRIAIAADPAGAMLGALAARRARAARSSSTSRAPGR